MLSVCLVCIFSTARLQAGGDRDIDHRNSRISPTSAGNVPSSPPIISVHVFMTKESHAVVHLLTCVRIFVSPWTAVRQASLSITNSWNLLKLLSIKSVMPSISPSVVPFSSCLQSFPASRSFPISYLFASGSIGASASASVLPMYIQGYFL